MKRITLHPSVAFALLVFTATSAFAQPTINFTITERGISAINGNAGPPGVIGVEPISGLQTVFYPLPGGYAGNPGDILLREFPSIIVSDIIRFPGNGNVYFFSELEEGEIAADPADVPVLPNPITPNIVRDETGLENGQNGYFSYWPQATGIGGDPAGQVVYNFISDEQVVPEPSTRLLLGLAAIPVILRRRSGERG